ncbi:hypothetical protein L873DRAFT_1668488 [Choiromyces venosus 120613-1]|uniref:BTB domain-containing protein n=1 Tax=Choiromyces venosus 120613-1 TaxID=1336337 RepID=A0A3N4K486_9PEZI|nr:hypothetical protein L873DRAFT_1668488 [Choiromyces venosus 120613-1]
MEPKTEVMDPYGDVLAILPCSPTPTKLQISSKILSTASPVFRSMFSPRFREGAALASSSSPTKLIEIEFPDDSAQALEAVFNVLHFRHDHVSANVSFEVLYEIALVADKYDVTAALGPWKEGFRKGCREAIVQDPGEWEEEEEEEETDKRRREAGKSWGCEALPEKVIESISAARTSTIQSLLSVAEHFRTLYQDPGIKCKVRTPTSVFGASNTQALTCDAAILGSLLRHYAAIGIFPVPPPPYKGISVESLALAMKNLRCFVDFDAGHGGCMVVGQVVKMVDEVLAGVDRLDIWEFVGRGRADGVEDGDGGAWWVKGSGFVDRERSPGSRFTVRSRGRGGGVGGNVGGVRSLFGR